MMTFCYQTFSKPPSDHLPATLTRCCSSAALLRHIWMAAFRTYPSENGPQDSSSHQRSSLKCSYLALIHGPACSGERNCFPLWTAWTKRLDCLPILILS